jgi:hypothetical protein
MNEQREHEFYYPDPTVRIPWRMIACVTVLLLCTHVAFAQAAPTFTASVTKGISPVATTFTWACPAGTVSATASSTGNQPAWTGIKSTSGTQNLSGIKLTADYKLDCTGPAGTGSVTVTWVPPTQNTDGSPLSNLAGYRIQWGASASTLGNQTDVANPAATSASVDKIPGGTWLFGVKAYSKDSIESVWSSPLMAKTVTVTPPVTQSASVTITVQTQPNPPTSVTVDTIAYEVNKATDAIKLAAVGTVPLGVNCKPEYDANGLNVVPRDRVKFKSATRPLVVVAKCG